MDLHNNLTEQSGKQGNLVITASGTYMKGVPITPPKVPVGLATHHIPTQRPSQAYICRFVQIVTKLGSQCVLSLISAEQSL